MRYDWRLVSFGLALALTGLAAPLLHSARPAEKPPDERFTQRERQHWAFQKVRRPEPPPVRHKHWVRNHLKLTYLHNGRFERATINGGKLIAEALA